ncbi:MAG: ABC transporter permease [Candidatus Thermoplasmatota archaeon]|nr:ABC transporter permease [Candidatus Thermoplasmatota archaeon]MCL5984208.1 ABC transporter permease [Candidatus Thermoplasmatota archaeon]
MALPNLLRLMYRNFRVNTDPGSLVILIGLPALYLVFFGFGFSSLGGGGTKGTSYLSFLTPGIMAFQVVMAGTVGGSILWADRRWGMLAQLLVSPFTRLEYLLGIMLTSVLMGIAGAFTMLVVALALLGSVPVGGFGLGIIVVTLILGSILFGSAMLFISALVKSSNAYNSIQVLMIFIVNFASTVFYPDSPSLPLPIQVLFAVNPLTYVADIVRDSYFGLLTVTDAYRLLLLTVEAVVLLYVATRAYMRSDVSMK